MSDYTIWDGFKDRDKPLVSVTADNLDAFVRTIAMVGDSPEPMYDFAVDIDATDGPHTVRQLARRIGTHTYITNADGTYPEA